MANVNMIIAPKSKAITPHIAPSLLLRMPSGSKSVKKVKYFAFSALPPTFASIFNTYIIAGIPAPSPILYFVSENRQEAKKQIAAINN